MMYGDEIFEKVNFKKSPGIYAGKSVRLRFALKDADVYAFRFTGE